MRTLFRMFLPDEALPLFLAVAGILVMFGFRQLAAGLVVGVLTIVALGPFVDALASQLPAWVLLILLGGIALMVLGSVTRMILGRDATNHMVGILAADVVRACVLGVLWPFRVLARTLIGRRR